MNIIPVSTIGELWDRLLGAFQSLGNQIEQLIVDLAVGFNSILEFLKLLAESLYNLIRWIPTAFLYTSGNSYFNFIPVVFFGIASISIVIFLLKIFVGGNK